MSSIQAAAPNERGVSVLDAQAVGRAVRRMAHEIVERNQGTDGVVLVGLIEGGTWLADAIGDALRDLAPKAPEASEASEASEATEAPEAGEPGEPVPVGRLDVSFHRDDIGLRPVRPARSEIPFVIDDRTVVLVDDVLFTGRTVRAALDALREYGRPRCVQLAVMVDRGHRELPIRPDYVGKNLPTSRDEEVTATAAGVVISR